SPGGHFAWTNMTVRQLISSAYAGRNFVDVVGGPKWVYSDRFDVAATSPSALSSIGPDGTPTLLFAMLRQLLESRFRLVVHDADEERPVYALQLVKPNAFGARLVKSDVDCAAVSEQLARGTRPPPRPGQAPPCSVAPRPGHLTARGVSLSRLAAALSPFTDRPVIDRTGVAGALDVDLEWTPDMRAVDPADALMPRPGDGPSIFTAVQEQLGLKLQPIRASVRVLGIDAAEPPKPN
ncbi:MAG TPA: TIGR03435 family protein, partial [Vicinamibacterales bacterium]|nr:TIGR03435 family protein [Vicinamibacterales bacterium]